MKKEERASFSIIKIICVSIILILISGIGVMAVSTNLNDVKIILQNGYELTALTSKTKVSEILEESTIFCTYTCRGDLEVEVMYITALK